MPDFEEALKNPTLKPLSEAPEQKDINDINEKEFLDKTKKRNKKSLIRLDYVERERIATHIKALYDKRKSKHKEIEDNMDNYDDVYRMTRATIQGADTDTPDYRTPLSTITLETIHANEMNVFFTPKDTVRVIPTEQGDISKVQKLDIFANWSMKNEMDLEAKMDRLFHASAKNGEAPYMVHWVKEYGTEIKIETVPDPTNPDKPLIDEDTKEPIKVETEQPKLLYNGPKLEVFSRKDYFQPDSAVADKTPEWEGKRVRISADEVNRKDMEGEYYPNVFSDIGGWGQSTFSNELDNSTKDEEGGTVPLGETEKLFMLWFGRLRVNTVKTGKKQGDEQFEELEDEFIAVIELTSQTLCSLKKNKFPLKMRPLGLDMFMPDDTGLRRGIGSIEFMQGIQNMDDLLHNQYLFGTIQSNSPFGFFEPTGNQRSEPIKAKSGFLYPTSNSKSVNIVKLPPPDQSLAIMIDKVAQWAQLLFGISAFKAGVESKLDKDAPARKVAIVVQQGDVRLNLIIKRKNRTLKDIFKRWFLLYQANMPPNKFMRIAGEDSRNPWKFEAINITDFALKSIPDFELVGNILNSNKALEAQKALAIYNVLVTNPFFNPQTREGLQSLHALTKWFMDKLDEVGISNFLPSPVGDKVSTPEEENARFMQGDSGEPEEGEDHVYHAKVHAPLVVDPTVPENIRKTVIAHLQQHNELMKKQITQQLVLAASGGANGQRPGTQQPSGNVLQGSGMGRPQGGVTANVLQ